METFINLYSKYSKYQNKMEGLFFYSKFSWKTLRQIKYDKNLICTGTNCIFCGLMETAEPDFWGFRIEFLGEFKAIFETA
jgi:hypothetical protein